MRPKPDFLPRMRGATGSVAGRRGLVPKPAAADNVKYLKGDGSWSALANASAATNAEAAAGASTTTFLTPAGATLSAGHAGRSSRPGIISTGASAVGTTQDNTGLAFGTGDLSLGAWVRFADWTPGSDAFPFMKGTSGISGVQLWLLANGKLRLRFCNPLTDYESTVATGVADGAWAHLAVTIDRDGNAVFYVNGAALGAAVAISAQSAQSLTSVSALLWMSATAGTLGETFIVSGLLTATNIADIYKAGSIAPFSASFTFFQWCDFDQGYGPIIKDRSGQNQPALMGTSGLTHAVPRNPPGVPQRAPRAALVMDGASGSRAYSTLGTQDPTTGDFSLAFDAVGSLGTGGWVALTANNTTADIARALSVYVDSPGAVNVMLRGATSGDYRLLTFNALNTLLNGQRFTFYFTRSGTTKKAYVGIGGDLFDVTALCVETLSATPPTWADTITGTYLLLGQRAPTAQHSGPIFDARLANVAMTEAQLRTEYERGEPGPEWSWGSKTPTYSSDFSASADSWVGTGGTTVTGNTDAIGAVDNTLKAEVTIAGLSLTRSLTLPKNRRYRITLDVYRPAANVSAVKVDFDALSTGLGWAYGATVADTWTAITQDLTLADSATTIRLLARSAADSASLTIGDILYFKNVVITPLGYTSRLRTDTAAGLTALDGSTNKNDFLLSTTGVKVSPDGRTQTIRATTNTSGNQQLAGASVIDTTKRWRIRSWNINSSGTPTVSLGNVSAGAQYLSGAALTATNNEVTLLTRIPGTANLWCNSSSTATLEHTVILEQVD